MANKPSFPGLVTSCSLRKCFTLFITLSFLTFGPLSCLAQSLNIQSSSISVEDLLQEITVQSGMDFSFSSKLINPKRKISFKVKNATLENTLDLLSQKLNIAFSMVDQQIILHEPLIVDDTAPLSRPKKFYTISGFINDAQSGESLIGATVSIKGTAQGVSTNSFGFYALQLPQGDHTLLVSYVGFQAQQMMISLVKNQNQDIPLQAASVDLITVNIQNHSLEYLQNQQSGAMDLNPDDLNNMPEFGGESGLIRGLQSLPGIKSHSDGSAFFFVRGGHKDQNLIIIDDAPIYNPSHLFGFYSVIVPEFTKSMQIYKSDIPVHLGDRLSSIVDIRTKDGNLNKTEINAAFNPLVSRLSLEGPVKEGKSSYFISYRASNFKWIYKNRSPEANLKFSDFNFKWNYKINTKNRLYFTLFIADDQFQNTGILNNSSSLGWRNVASTIRWNHIFGERLFSNTILYSGNYNYRISNGVNRWDSSIGRASLKSDFTYYHRNNQTSKFGIEFNGFTFNPGGISGEGFTSLFPKIQQDKARETVLYANHEFKWGKRWILNAGFRTATWENLGPNTYFNFDENYELIDSVVTEEEVYQRYQHFDPRLQLQYKTSNTSSIKLSYGRYNQNLQLITNSTSPFTALEVWLPSSPNIKPQSAHQFSLSYSKHFPKKQIDLTAEAYYKDMNNQIDYVDHANTLLNPLVEGQLRFGTMESYGLELMLKKKVGRLNGWMTYTYSRAMRQTPDVNSGRIYPAFQDRPHDFSVMLNYGLKPRILLSAYWTWYTGSTFSSPTGFYTFNDQTVPIYDEKHNDRLPNYNRLDIAFKFILNKKATAKFQHDLTFSIYNVLAHKNVIDVNFNKIENGNARPIVQANLLAEDQLRATQSDLLRFFPSLTYTFKL